MLVFPDAATHGRSRLPYYLKTMMKTAKKHKVCFAAVKLGHKLKKSLPMWYHLGAVKRLRLLNNTRTSKCLRECHQVVRVADVVVLANRACTRVQPPAGAQRQSRPETTCQCGECVNDVASGCRNPRRCCAAAATLLEQIKEKWHPNQIVRTDGLSLTTRRKEKNAGVIEDGVGSLTFDPSLEARDLVSESFRVFVDPATHEAPPALRVQSGRSVPAEA
ncbi:hypothetical protein FOMPIDRAFT_1135932, partial [Fomitopsis schrenkii]